MKRWMKKRKYKNIYIFLYYLCYSNMFVSLSTIVIIDTNYNCINEFIASSPQYLESSPLQSYTLVQGSANPGTCASGISAKYLHFIFGSWTRPPSRRVSPLPAEGSHARNAAPISLTPVDLLLLSSVVKRSGVKCRSAPALHKLQYPWGAVQMPQFLHGCVFSWKPICGCILVHWG